MGDAGIHIDVLSISNMDEIEWIHNRMTALWYKWYIHLREEGGYSIGTALVAGWWNAGIFILEKKAATCYLLLLKVGGMQF